jgi:tetratricopeptide (TPR) repeat protein
MRSFRAELALLLLWAVAAVLAAGCAAHRPETAAELDPLEPGGERSVALPDDTEVAAGRLAAMVLADRPDSAASYYAEMREAEDRRRATDAPRTGLLDNARDLQNSLEGTDDYADHARRMLAQDDLDPVLRRRLEVFLESQPLAIAEERLREDRRVKVASVFNRLVEPMSRLALGASLNPIETGRAAIASALVMHSFPEATVRERQALRAYQDFLDRYPEAPEAPEVAARMQEYQQQWIAQLHGEALEVARTSLEAGHPEVALVHLDRADRLQPDNEESAELRQRARAQFEGHEARVAQSLRAQTLVGQPLDRSEREALESLAVAVLAEPADEVARRADGWRREHPGGLLSDEARFLESLRLLAAGEEDRFFEALGELIQSQPDSNMSRHAARTLSAPDQNPSAFYRAALHQERRQRFSTLMLGSRARGPRERGLPRPLEWLIDLPGMASSLVTFPVRLLGYGQIRARLAGPILHRGEQYVARFPDGEHAEEVHRELESQYARREQWSQALEHHRAREKPDPKKVAKYREKIAERTLEAAGQQRRIDARIAIYRAIIEEYSDTPQAAEARRELQQTLADHTPQQIRISKEFLLEHPPLWGPDALALRPELLDGDGDNGEIPDEGITLLGLNLIRIPLAGREPAIQRLPEENFARFVALLEVASYERLATDPREQPVSDPQRDYFFERARLGLLDEPDLRPSATSWAVFEGTTETHGLVRRRDSVLPVELVLQGGLEDFAFSAFPRMKLPARSDDAFLYE